MARLEAGVILTAGSPVRAAFVKDGAPIHLHESLAAAGIDSWTHYRCATPSPTGRAAMLETIEGASFHPAQAVQLRRAYDIACGVLSPDGPLDNVISRKLASALIRYARLGEERLPEEIARLAVIHVRLASAPLVV